MSKASARHAGPLPKLVRHGAQQRVWLKFDCFKWSREPVGLRGFRRRAGAEGGREAFGVPPLLANQIAKSFSKSGPHQVELSPPAKNAVFRWRRCTARCSPAVRAEVGARQVPARVPAAAEARPQCAAKFPRAESSYRLFMTSRTSYELLEIMFQHMLNSI